jgi:uncharacterized protein YndB with AHSA1/START domain
MELEARAEIRIARPAAEVFQAIVDPEKMSGYFISSGSGRLEAGATVQWTWGDVGAHAAVQVLTVDEGRAVSFTWGPAEQASRVDLVLVPESAEATAVEVTEGRWASDDAGIARLASQTFGWAHFLLCMKAYLEHGIHLRQGSITRKHLEQIRAAR